MIIPPVPSQPPSSSSISTVVLPSRIRSRWLHFILGLIVSLLIGLILWQSSLTHNQGRYVLFGQFRNIGALDVGDDVSMGGALVGHVSSVNLDNQTLMAHVGITITKVDLRIPIDSAMTIQNLSVLGGAAVRIVPGYEEETLASAESFLYVQPATDVLSLLQTAISLSRAKNQPLPSPDPGGSLP